STPIPATAPGVAAPVLATGSGIGRRQPSRTPRPGPLTPSPRRRPLPGAGRPVAGVRDANGGVATEGERKPSATSSGDYEPSPATRGVGQRMAPSTERHQLVEIEVGAALGPLHQVVHVKPAPGSAGLTAPTRARQDNRFDSLPLRDRGGGAARGAGASSTA